MKPIDLTKPLQTRDGRPAKFLHKLESSTSYPLVFVIGKPGEEELERYSENGSSAATTGYRNDNLINVPVKHVREYWVNLYPEDHLTQCECGVHKSRDAADKQAGHDSRLACKKITVEFEENEGLD